MKKLLIPLLVAVLIAVAIKEYPAMQRELKIMRM
jgi:hypothetical protein